MVIKLTDLLLSNSSSENRIQALSLIDSLSSNFTFLINSSFNKLNAIVISSIVSNSKNGILISSNERYGFSNNLQSTRREVKEPFSFLVTRNVTFAKNAAESRPIPFSPCVWRTGMPKRSSSLRAFFLLFDSVPIINQLSIIWSGDIPQPLSINAPQGYLASTVNSAASLA